MPTKHRTKRRAISIRGITHQRLLDHLGSASMSGFLEKLIAEKLDAAGVPVPAEVKPCKHRPDAEVQHGQHHTF